MQRTQVTTGPLSGGPLRVVPHERLEVRARLADAVFMHTQEGIVITDPAGCIVAVNPAFCAISEFPETELLGRSLRVLRSGRHDRAFYAAMWASLLATGAWQGEVWNRRKGGEIYPQWLAISTVRNEAGERTHFLGVATDISRMHCAEAHLAHFAHHDPLTSLPNRSLLRLRLAHSIERAARDASSCAVLFLDLDGFKCVNDTIGHRAGDELLQLVARRLERRLREIDTLARLGGDEFIVVLERVAAAGDAARAASDLAAEAARAFTLTGGRRVRIGVSIGIALSPADGARPDTLIDAADRALYRAKAAGGGTWRFVDGTGDPAPGKARAAQKRKDPRRSPVGGLSASRNLRAWQ